jgi:hypothetical protein
MVKSCKKKDYTDGNVEMAWERLENKYEPTSASSLVKTERFFRKRFLCKKKIQMLELQPLKNSE